MTHKTVYILALILLSMPFSSVFASETGKLDELAKLIAFDIAESFPHLVGQVLSVKSENEIYLGLGSKDNVSKGDKFEVFSQGKEPVKDEKGNLICYVGERLALVEIEWIEEDYSFAKVIELFSDHPVDSYDILNYVPPARSIFLRPLKGQYGPDLAERIAPVLAQIPNIKLVNSEEVCDYYIDGDVSKKTYGIIAKLFLFKKGALEPATKIERGLSLGVPDITKPISGKGYQAWQLPPDITDFIFLENDRIMFLGKNEIFETIFTPSGMQLENNYSIGNDEKAIVREPIGRLHFFDLDNDGSREILEFRAGHESGQFLSDDNGALSIEGFLPGIPLSVDNKGHLLITELMTDFNLFDPQKTRVISISSTGFMQEKNLTSISSPFVDAAFVETNDDESPELAIVFPDGKLILTDSNYSSSSLSVVPENVGMGIFQDDEKFIYTSSNSRNQDYIIKWSMVNGRLVKQSQSPVVPFRILRIRSIGISIAALALDEDMPVLVIFDEF